MKIFSANQIREIDRFTIENEPISSVDLMERAAGEICRWFAQFIGSEKEVVIYAGPGNNGGDGLALARMLVEIGYSVRVYILHADSYSKDFEVNFKRLKSQSIIHPVFIKGEDDFPTPKGEEVIVDALFGSGLTRALAGLSEKLVKYINASQLVIVSIDIPSGLFCDDNPYPNSIPVVQAAVTLTLQFPKLSFFFAENNQFVGHLEVLPIGLHSEVIESTTTPYIQADFDLASSLLKPRSIFDHKGYYGHSLIIAGSYGMIGASVLASSACIRAGAGLVTAHIPRLGNSIVQQAVPEAMVDVDDNDSFFTGVKSTSKYTAIGIGPGLGKSVQSVLGFRALLKQIKVPLLIDADGLNIISENLDILEILPEQTVITPHPGEFDRLFGRSECGHNRLKLAIENSKKYRIVIVLKGANTQIVCPDGEVYFNPTGNPGMATGGSGDVLSGIITSLLGQGYDSASASILGVYLHGLAGDIAADEIGMNALKAYDIIDSLGEAFNLIEI